MKSHIRLAGTLSLLGFCLVFVACKADPFIGTWKPAPTGESDRIHIGSMEINKDGTFSLKPKDSSRKEIKGTYSKTGDMLELSSPDLRQKVQATMDSDGRMKISEGGRDPMFFVKG